MDYGVNLLYDITYGNLAIKITYNIYIILYKCASNKIDTMILITLEYYSTQIVKHFVHIKLPIQFLYK